MQDTNLTIINILLAVISGIILTHYFEIYEVKIFINLSKKLKINHAKKIRNLNKTVPESLTDSLSKVEIINPVQISRKVKKNVDMILDLNYKGVDRTEIIELLDEIEITKIIKTADFFIDYATKNSNEDFEFWLFPYNFDYHSYDSTLKAPWYSAMAQGFAIETLLGAYVITGYNKYLDAAKKSANAMYINVIDGGVSIEINNDSNSVWFEEYASEKIESPMVLNGHNFALIGIGRLIFFDESYVKLYKKGVNGLKEMLPQFNLLVWSRYDLTKYLASHKYQKIHVRQLFMIAKKNNDGKILMYARLFMLQCILPFGIFYRLSTAPHNSIIIVTIFNSVIMFILLLLFG